MDEFDRTPVLEGAGIRVAVRNGAVTLTGTVATQPESALAVSAALRVPGVNAVAADLTIARTGPLSDSEIAREASVALGRAIGLAANLVKATVADSWVTLTGQVENHYQRDVADHHPYAGICRGAQVSDQRCPSAQCGARSVPNQS